MNEACELSIKSVLIYKLNLMFIGTEDNPARTNSQMLSCLLQYLQSPIHRNARIYDTKYKKYKPKLHDNHEVSNGISNIINLAGLLFI